MPDLLNAANVSTNKPILIRTEAGVIDAREIKHMCPRDLRYKYRDEGYNDVIWLGDYDMLNLPLTYGITDSFKWCERDKQSGLMGKVRYYIDSDSWFFPDYIAWYGASDIELEISGNFYEMYYPIFTVAPLVSTYNEEDVLEASDINNVLADSKPLKTDYGNIDIRDIKHLMGKQICEQYAVTRDYCPYIIWEGDYNSSTILNTSGYVSLKGCLGHLKSAEFKGDKFNYCAIQVLNISSNETTLEDYDGKIRDTMYTLIPLVDEWKGSLEEGTDAINSSTLLRTEAGVVDLGKGKYRTGRNLAKHSDELTKDVKYVIWSGEYSISKIPTTYESSFDRTIFFPVTNDLEGLMGIFEGVDNGRIYYLNREGEEKHIYTEYNCIDDDSAEPYHPVLDSVFILAPLVEK